MENLYDVTIIIVNYNSVSFVKNCIHSVIENTLNVKYEIIIVDNDSSEDISQLETICIGQDSQISVKVLRLKENIGFGRANNEGIRKAAGRNILFLNPDTILLNDAVSLLSLHLDNNKNIGGCGGNLFDAQLTPTRSHRLLFPSLSWLIGNFFFSSFYDKIIGGKNLFFNYSNSPIDVKYIVGADLMVPRRVLEEVGYFDPAFFMYYEEIELCNRIIQKGYSVQNIPYSKIQHLEGKSSNNIEKKAKMHYMSSRLYYSKTHSRFYNKLVKMVLWALIYQRMGIAKLMKNTNSLKFWKTQYHCLKSDSKN